MVQQSFQLTRRQFIASAALATGGMAIGAAPVFAQKPKLVYWAYQFLRSSDEARVAFAEEWAKQNKVDMQITLVPWKEFMAKISAAIHAKATPDIVESGGVQLRSQGQLLEVTDVYEQLEKEHGGWLGAAELYMKEADGRAHHILYGLTGSMVIARNDLVSKAGASLPAETWEDLFNVAKKTNSPPRVYGLGQPVSNQTDSNIWGEIMRSYGTRLADDEGKKIVLGDYKSDVWTFLDFFQEIWDSGVLPPGVTTWDNTMNNSTYQAGKSVIALNPITITLWLENNDSDLLPKTGHYSFPKGPKRHVWDVGYGSRSILKYTQHPELCKQFLLDSMGVAKMEKELAVSQWAPVLKSYLPFDIWNSSDHKKALVNVATQGNPIGAPDVYNDALVEQSTHTTISRMLQRIVVDKWSRDKAFDEAVDVLTKIYSKYA
jgi:multiple sugar transport system substrate-binding protein